MKKYVIENDVVGLREARYEDCAKIIKWRNSEDVRKHYIYRELLTLEQEQKFFKEKIETGIMHMFIICVKNDSSGQDREVGCAVFNPLDEDNSREYGLFIGESLERGKGIGQNVTFLANSYVFLKYHMPFSRAKIFDDNITSVKSATRGGLRITGKIEDIVCTDGCVKQMYSLEMNPSDVVSKLCEASFSMLEKIKHPDLKDKVKSGVKKAIGRGGLSKDLLFWPAGMLLLGLTEDTSIEQSLDLSREYISYWEKQNKEFEHVDDALFGVTFLRMFEKTGDIAYLKHAEKLAFFLENAKKDKKGSVIYNVKGVDDYVLADGVGMVSMFFAAFGKVLEKIENKKELDKKEDNALNKYSFDSKKAYNIALANLLNFKKYSTEEATKLPYHGYSFMETESNHDEDNNRLYPQTIGILGWGRAIGWLMLGISECLVDIPKDFEGYEELLKWMRKLTCKVLESQRNDGLFSWVMPGNRSRIDSSASGMIIYSIKKASKFIEGDMLSKELLEERILLGATGLFKLINQDGHVTDALGPCEDLGVYRQIYSSYPWGQGAVLAALSKCFEN
ncbi:GNAT family N-acetyltransferase [Butyrivibrio sp. NC3005]|uniref:GNAT family N-acetyltransferase n=1 Tax=Butyrivibrio sp. NC3005 TaxID=1280685 RepID=UPI00041A9E09|nr:GNAT family N-acetyltransferase [Butyrivibrio sp. NC3005]